MQTEKQRQREREREQKEDRETHLAVEMGVAQCVVKEAELGRHDGKRGAETSVGSDGGDGAPPVLRRGKSDTH